LCGGAFSPERREVSKPRDLSLGGGYPPVVHAEGMEEYSGRVLPLGELGL